MRIEPSLIERLHKADPQHFPVLGSGLGSVRFQKTNGRYFYPEVVNPWEIAGWAWEQLPKGTLMGWSDNVRSGEFKCVVHVRTPEGWDIGTQGCRGRHESVPVAILLAYCMWKEALSEEAG